MKKLLLGVLMPFLFPTALVMGSGVPTADFANFTQNLARYLNELKEYAEILELKTVEVAHYYETYRTYQQKLLEYQHYLNEIMALKDQIDRRDWWAINEAVKRNLRRVKSLHQKYMDEADPDAVTADDDLTKMLRNYDEVPLTDAEMTDFLNALNTDSTTLKAQIDRDRINYQLKKERLKDAARFEQRSHVRRDRSIPAHQKIARNLGNESTLATRQAMALQGITEMEQNEDLINLDNQIFSNMQDDAAFAASQSTKMMKADFERMQNRKPTRPYGANRFGPFH